MPRVAIGGISHETNTFSSIQTTLTDFQRRALARGRTIIETSRGAGTALGGMVDTALALRWDLVPTLFAATDDGMELGLYLDASVLERLGRRCPLVALDESNLGDYCTALEGVSHFHYVTWSAGLDRRVSLLELELQAEVDKYASALSLLLAQREGRFPGELFQRLFEGCRLLPHLTAAERERYSEAHRCAARFCERLETRFLRRRQARPASDPGSCKTPPLQARRLSENRMTRS